MTTTGDPFDPHSKRVFNPKLGKSLLTAGDGIPWEDRGSLGLPAAYFKTVFRMLFSPLSTVDQIKRIDSQKDPLSFVIVSAIPWFISAWIHTFIHYYLTSKVVAKNDGYILVTSYFTRSFFASIILGFGVIAMFNIGAKIYYGMVKGDDMKGRGSQELIYNVYAYCLAPSILAMIPFIGPPAAIIWGFVLSIVTGINRLRVKAGGAATAACFSLLLGLLFVGGALALGLFFWNWLIGNPIVYPVP